MKKETINFLSKIFIPIWHFYSIIWLTFLTALIIVVPTIGLIKTFKISNSWIIVIVYYALSSIIAWFQGPHTIADKKRNSLINGIINTIPLNIYVYFYTEQSILKILLIISNIIFCMLGSNFALKAEQKDMNKNKQKMSTGETVLNVIFTNQIAFAMVNILVWFAVGILYTIIRR